MGTMRVLQRSVVAVGMAVLLTVLPEVLEDRTARTSDFGFAVAMGGRGFDRAQAVAPDAAGNVDTTGAFTNMADFDPGAGTVNLTSAGSSEGLVAQLTQRTVGGRIWHDRNGNGIQDAGEPGIAGAVVELFGSPNTTSGDGDDVTLGVQVTDAQGAYRFVSPREFANYFLVFRPPVGFAFTGQDAGGDDTRDSDVAPLTGRTVLFRLPAGANSVALDAGLTGAAPGFGFALGAESPPGGGIAGHSLATDVAGNVYVTGSFQGGTVDFDPGPGRVPLTSGFDGDFPVSDVFVAKYTAVGALAWVRQLGGQRPDEGTGVAVDGQGNVYITGTFMEMVDFDPGPEVYTLTSAVGTEDVFVVKLDRDGTFVWARRMGGDDQDKGYGVAVDGQGNVYITGFFWEADTVDFDPGPEVYTLTSAGSADVFVAKLDRDGAFVWARRLGGREGDRGYGVAVDGQSNVYITGTFEGRASVDPEAGTVNLTSADGTKDVFVAKLDRDGIYRWARRLGGSRDDAGHGVAVDRQGNVYITGSFQGTADFDPGPGVVNLTSAGNADGFVWKLDSGGTFVWARRLGGSRGDAGRGVAVDEQGNVYTTGAFMDTVDFVPRPGPGAVKLTSAGGTDGFVWKLDSDGTYRWVQQAGGSGPDGGAGIAVDGQGNVYTTGEITGPADFDPGSGTFNLPSGFFVWKVAIQPQTPGNLR